MKRNVVEIGNIEGCGHTTTKKDEYKWSNKKNAEKQSEEQK